MTELAKGQRVDWWQVLDDLRRVGLGFDAVSKGTGIPVSTLAGYKNLNAEPKHADGSLLVSLWKARHDGAPVPVVRGSVRNGLRA
jgi:hypothetical protein